MIKIKRFMKKKKCNNNQMGCQQILKVRDSRKTIKNKKE